MVWDHQAEGSSPSVWTICRYSTADSISAFQAEDEGSIPFTCSKRVLFGLYKCSLMCNNFLPPFPNNTLYATVVQLVERLICNQYVTGSSPVGSSRVPSQIRLV